jgi:hypothetical protein
VAVENQGGIRPELVFLVVLVVVGGGLLWLQLGRAATHLKDTLKGLEAFFEEVL